MLINLTEDEAEIVTYALSEKVARYNISPDSKAWANRNDAYGHYMALYISREEML